MTKSFQPGDEVYCRGYPGVYVIKNVFIKWAKQAFDDTWEIVPRDSPNVLPLKANVGDLELVVLAEFRTEVRIGNQQRFARDSGRRLSRAERKRMVSERRTRP